MKTVVCSLLFLICFLFGVSAVFGQATPPLVKLEAGRAENISGSSANSNGVFPVRLRWQRPDGGEAQSYNVYRSERAAGGFQKISARPVTNNAGNAFTFIDANSAAVPGKPYYYYIMIANPDGEDIPFSETVTGYGALTHERYFLEYLKTVVSSHKKLVYMNKSGAIAKLGSEEQPGDISGTLSYNAQRVGLGGRVIMEYIRYADFFINNDRTLGSYFILNGNTNTTANMAQNGTMDGTVNITGMYPGRVFYDRIEIKGGAARGGTYGVEPRGFPRVELDWTIGE